VKRLTIVLVRGKESWGPGYEGGSSPLPHPFGKKEIGGRERSRTRPHKKTQWIAHARFRGRVRDNATARIGRAVGFEGRRKVGPAILRRARSRETPEKGQQRGACQRGGDSYQAKCEEH